MTQPIPNTSVAPIDPRTGKFVSEWYRFFQFGGTTTEAATQPEYKLTGNASVVVRGLLANGVASLALAGDSVSPGASTYYGTDESGEKGFHDLMPRVLARLSMRV